MTHTKAKTFTDDAALLTMHDISGSGNAQIGILLLNRPASANALSADLMATITRHLQSVQENPRCRLLVLSAKGKHFSAGADLNWMKASAALSRQENVADANRLTEMFESLANSKIPTLGVIRGAAYGGAVGLTACCDISIAVDSARFCLSEARLGIAPAVIMPYLSRKMLPGHLRRNAMTARVFTGAEALENGLVDVLAAESQVDDVVRQEINGLLSCGPKALTCIKSLLDEVRHQGQRQGPYTAETIATLRTSSEGQDGLAAFFAKAPAPWSISVSDTWSFNALCS